MPAVLTERANGECKSLVNRLLSSGFYTTCALLPLVLALALALVVLRFGRPMSFEGIGYWIRDGPGALYVTAVAANRAWQNFLSGLITADEFLAELRVKVGHAHNLPVRRGKYRRCDVGQTHFWLYCFYPKKRINKCAICASWTPTRLVQFWIVSGFAKVEERVRGVLALLGQPDLPREDLDERSWWIGNDEMYIDSYHVQCIYRRCK
ncbi:hypothetical protein C8F04DRAFT_1265701 [Mycena alexandri]|uniref:Uncharacterized protein n=1 Tax=Mycena alexandri TaxID=1745969 RepID=A0AAD6WXW6_9AGAR|nr:hypothetical protein C8F04DRAFT_1265701 [Mycena alexandri]